LDHRNPYEQIQSGVHSTLNWQGAEGGVKYSILKSSRTVFFHAKAEPENSILRGFCGIARNERKKNKRSKEMLREGNDTDHRGGLRSTATCRAQSGLGGGVT